MIAINQNEPSLTSQWCLGLTDGSIRQHILTDIDLLLAEYTSTYKGGTVPINLYALAALRGCKISYLNLPQGVQGSLVPLSDGFVINVNAERMGVVRQRFTIAHELIHTFFYIFKNGRPTKVTTSLSLAEEERLCDYGAGSLLVPDQFLGDILSSFYSSSAGHERLAAVWNIGRKFRVSTEVAARRLLSSEFLTGSGICEWLAQDVYLKNRKSNFTENSSYDPLVMTWMIPTGEHKRLKTRRGQRLRTGSLFWKFCIGSVDSVKDSEVAVGKGLVAKLSEAVVERRNDRPYRALASIQTFTETR